MNNRKATYRKWISVIMHSRQTILAVLCIAAVCFHSCRIFPVMAQEAGSTAEPGGTTQETAGNSTDTDNSSENAEENNTAGTTEAPATDAPQDTEMPEDTAPDSTTDTFPVVIPDAAEGANPNHAPKVALGSAAAANPRVMISDYEVEEGKITAGGEFILVIHLKNTAAKAVRNLKLTVISENGEFLPVEGAGTAYTEKIDGKGETEFRFSMTAIHGLEEKSYKLSLKTEYEDSNGTEYTVDENIFLPVSLEQRVSVSDVFLPESSVELGDTVEISASVNNLGDAVLYNVTAKVWGDVIEEQSTYIGNLESGKRGTIDVLTKAISISDVNTAHANRILISYEDKNGKVYSEEFSFKLEVTQPVYEDLEKIKESPDYSGIVRTVIWIVVAAAVLALIVWLLIQRRKRQQKILEEF